MTDVIRTDRLGLRSWAETDLDAFFAVYSRAEVMRWLGSTRRPLATRDEAGERLAQRAAPDPAGPPHGVWAVCDADDAAPVGSVLLRPLPWSAAVEPTPAQPDVEVGWHLHPDVWGRGYATEAARAMLARAAAHRITAVHAVTHPENDASQRVCRRLGMTYVGRTERYYDVELDLFRVELPAVDAGID